MNPRATASVADGTESKKDRGVIRRALRRFRGSSASASVRLPVAGVLSMVLIGGVWALPGSGAASAAVDPCPNADVRTGPSAKLPDCRAFELVSAQDTNGASPFVTNGSTIGSVNIGDARSFGRAPSSPSGDSFIYNIPGTAVPGIEGTGYANDYRATRGPDGWTSELVSMTGEQATFIISDGFSGDQQYVLQTLRSTEGLRNGGSFDTGVNTSYVRKPNGAQVLLGEGTLPAAPDTDGVDNGTADDPKARARWVGADGSHIIFESFTNFAASSVQLLPEAPPDGTAAVYDRTPDGLELISLLPGDVTPAGNSRYAGAAEDGSVVAFYNGTDLYARIDNAITLPVASGLDTTSVDRSGGVSENGRWIFYTRDGDLFRFNTDTEVTDQITNSGDAQFIFPSPDGSRVYFASQSQLDGSEGSAGGANIYLWDGLSTDFVAEVTSADLFTQPGGGGTSFGIAKWTSGSSPTDTPATQQSSATVRARTTPDGKALAFESTSQLTAYDNAGKRVIYLYHADDESIRCVSCLPSGAAPSADMTFLNDGPSGVVGLGTAISNLSADGSTVFFQSDDGLVPEDVDGLRDAYEWRNGELSLLTSGNNSQPELLFGATPDASSVFVRTPQVLVDPAQGQEPGVPAIYAARVNGGFPPPEAATNDCTGETCQDDPTGSPAEDNLASTGAFPGNPDPEAKPSSCSRFDKKARKAKSKSRKLKQKAKRANSKKRSKRIRAKARKQRQKSKRSKRRAANCRGGSR